MSNVTVDPAPTPPAKKRMSGLTAGLLMFLAVLIVGGAAGGVFLLVTKPLATTAAQASQPTIVAPSSTTPTTPFDTRLKDCTTGLDVAGANVKDLLKSSPSAAIAGSAQPAEAAAKLRGEATATHDIIENARKHCSVVLPECPASADAHAAWLQQGVDSISVIADMLVGGSPASTTSIPKPTISCPEGGK